MLLKSLNGQSCTVTSATPNYGIFPAIGGHIASTLVLNPTDCTPVFDYYPTWVGIVYSGGIMHIYCSQNTGNQRSGYVVCNGSTFFYIQQAAAVFAPGTISGATSACYNQSPGTLSGTICSGVCYDKFYQWEKSTTSPQTGFTSITGATEQNYTPGPLTTTTYFRRLDQCDNQSGYTNVLTVTVSSSTPTPGTYGYNQVICINTAPDPITQISVPTGGLGTYTYQWLASTDDKSSWSEISGATQKDYSPGILSGRTYFKVKVISGSCNPVYSESILINVNPLADGGIIKGEQSVVHNREVSDILNVRAYPYTGTVSFEWEYSEDSTIWQSDASLGTSISCAPGILSNTTFFRRKMTDQCGVAYSNIVKKTILPSISGAVSDRGLSVNENYVYALEPNAEVRDRSELYYLPLDSIKHSVNYYDGLGQIVQQINITSTPDYCDLIRSNEYDALGREVVKRLPYPTLSSNYGEFDRSTNSLQEYYWNNFNDSTGLSKTIIEESPLNRILAQGSPGFVWQPYAHPIRFSYGTNKTEDVKNFHLGSNNSLVLSGWMEPGVLYKTTIMDENWQVSSSENPLLHTTEEFENYLGLIVLKRTYVKDGEDIIEVETYYVYDDFGLLRYVLPPEAVKNRGTQDTLYPYTPLVKNLCYYYQYDARKRMIIKQLPGAGQVHLVYDNRDRLIASQDSVQRAASKWLVTKYDHLNRPVMTALKSLADNRSTLQTYLDTCMSQNAFFESRTTSGVGYTLTNSFNPKLPLSEADLLTVTYYDTYDYPDSLPFNNNVRVSDYYNSTTGKYYCEQTRSLVTGSRVKVLDGTEHNSSGFRWLVSTIYYDDKYRPIQTLRDLYSTVTTDNEILSTQYDFTGKIIKTLTKQVFRDNINEVTETYLYDHADRLIQIKHKLNSGTDITLASMEYNDLGQLKRKALHGQIGAGIQDLNYAYNIRGWLEKINNPEVNPTTTSTQKLNLGLYYNNVPTGLSVSPQFNGNISAIAWNTPANTEALSPAYKQGYGFTYDPLNRLTAAVYGDSTNFAKSVGANNESYTYDLNGNILSLSRYLKETGLIDSLTYTYKNNGISNLLNKVEDAAGTSGFYNGSSSTNEYQYDGNGNLTADLNKGYTSILYNYLNLPKQIGTTSEKIKYIYDASGMKLAKVGIENDTSYYAGNFVYKGSSLNYIIHEEGHIEPSEAEKYKYYLKDHLGSVRMVVNTNGTGGTIESQKDYYPFGMTIAEYNGSVVDYGYNGKELQVDSINTKKLDWYDYGARFYDPQIGRWHSVDPMAHEREWLSPYNYCQNDPINRTDPTGALDGDYYNFDGTYLGSDGINDNKVYVVNCIDPETAAKGMSSSDLLYLRDKEHMGSTDPTATLLPITHSEFKAIAGTIYAEGTPWNLSFEEAAGIYSVMENRANASGTSVYNIASGSGINGWSERDKINSARADPQSVKNAYRGTIAGLTTSKDYSGGGYYWHGADFAKPTTGSSAHESFYKVGFNFTNQSHDIWNLGNIKSGNAGWNYKYQSTGAAGQTTFMKLTNEWIKANNYKGKW